MAHQRLGHARQARQWLDKACRKIGEKKTGARLPWYRRLTFQLLRREAEGLVKKSNAKGALSPSLPTMLAVPFRGRGRGGQWLSKAVQWIDQARPNGPSAEKLMLPWSDRLEVLLLRREAEAPLAREGTRRRK
jgi:hypothetical protein